MGRCAKIYYVLHHLHDCYLLLWTLHGANWTLAVLSQALHSCKVGIGIGKAPISIIIFYRFSGQKNRAESVTDINVSDEEDDNDEKEEDKEEKKSLREKLQAVQEVTALVQNALGYAAHFCEAVKNTFNFSVPFLSWLAIIILSIVSIFLFFIPCRVIIMLWGVNKFSRSLLMPNSVPNNELLDFLSRVPNDEMLKDSRELKLMQEESAQKRRNANRRKSQIK